MEAHLRSLLWYKGTTKTEREVLWSGGGPTLLYGGVLASQDSQNASCGNEDDEMDV